MGDPNDSPSPEPRPESEVCEEIGRAVGSLRQHNSGVRPTSVRTEYVGDIVRCTISEEAPPDSDFNSHHYKSRAEAAVARLTKRRVVGFVTKPGADDATTNTFILERVRAKF